MSIGPDLILYGGTFDPPHQGHVECLREAMKRFPQAEVWVLPGAQPAVAGGGGKRSVASFRDRFEMARLAFEDLQPGRVGIKSLELELPRPNYSWVTLSYVAEHQPGRRLGFLIGQDQLEAFASWKHPERILESADLVVVHRRRGNDDPAGNSTTLRSDAELMIRDLGFTPQWSEDGLVASFKEAQGRLILIDAMISPAQSSDIRHRVASGINAPEGWIPPRVVEYMREAHLYAPGLLFERT
jgi:nicotinate (nicotinamide) nucleotide adenylyltransferase